MLGDRLTSFRKKQYTVTLHNSPSLVLRRVPHPSLRSFAMLFTSQPWLDLASHAQIADPKACIVLTRDVVSLKMPAMACFQSPPACHHLVALSLLCLNIDPFLSLLVPVLVRLVPVLGLLAMTFEFVFFNALNRWCHK